MSSGIKRSCIDCGIVNCNLMEKEFPEFCLTTGTVTEEDLKYVREKYSEEENQKSMAAVACVEYEGYCQLTRVQEIMDYAKRMGQRSLGSLPVWGLSGSRGCGDDCSNKGPGAGAQSGGSPLYSGRIL